MKQACVIRHVAFEDLDAYATPLRDAGYSIDGLQAGVDPLLSAATMSCDLLVVLGGPIGVGDAADYAFIDEEIGLLRRRIRQGQPVFGVCLGAQLMASACGAPVYPASRPEIGWGSLSLTAAGLASPLKHLDHANRVLHWHGDTFDLPPGCERLASSEVCINQAFSAGPHALALQFHTEVSRQGLERWLIGHVAELRAKDISIARLREDTRQYADDAMRAGQAMFGDWLKVL